MSIEGTFNPQAIERELYAEWEQAGYFAPSGNGAPLLHRHTTAERH